MTQTAVASKERKKTDPGTRTDLSSDAVTEISSELRKLLADVFALYLKTKNFHWHLTGRHFRDYHLLLDEHSEQILSMTDDIAERARKLGGSTLRSISDVTRHQRLLDNNADFVPPLDMLAELRADNLQLTRYLRSTHEVCARHNDVATTSLIETWIDETERRTWFLSEIATDLLGIHRDIADLLSGSQREKPDLSFHATLNPGSATPEDIAELFESISQLNRAFGGQGIVFRQIEGAPSGAQLDS
ncbi:MAG: DNA starvation/stationary phase protection protein [Verrucomicrobia bacterium]|nr:DNA starvation/stationary phase protection protein [Verrucomicrobiota bacterium]MBV8277854.1 DNA starvation/stationary phase protection protein [Verrucomicrobiota bacterium]